MPLQVKRKDTTKELSGVQKNIDIARVRQYDMKKLFVFDLILINYLFDNIGCMSKLTRAAFKKRQCCKMGDLAFNQNVGKVDRNTNIQRS